MRFRPSSLEICFASVGITLVYSTIFAFSIPDLVKAWSYEPVSYGKPSEPTFDYPEPDVIKYS